MKPFLILFLMVVAGSACQNDSSPKTANELEKMKAELEAKKKELSDKQDIAALEEELKKVEGQIKQLDGSGSETSSGTGASVTTPLEAPPVEAKSHIVGTNVTMRKEASIRSDKLGSFKANEEVTVLETKNVNNENEAILTKPIPLYVSESNSGEVAMTLPKGKAVVIEKYNADDNKYEVSYQAEGKGKLYASIHADAVETISYSTWYRVRRSNGEEAWVLGKFLKM